MICCNEEVIFSKSKGILTGLAITVALALGVRLGIQKLGKAFSFPIFMLQMLALLLLVLGSRKKQNTINTLNI